MEVAVLVAYVPVTILSPQYMNLEPMHRQRSIATFYHRTQLHHQKALHEY
ncbi:hypothetical protein [Synechococcus sp. M16CYN]